MSCIPRWKRIVTRRDRIGIPPPAVTALDADFAAAKVADDFARATDSLILRIEYFTSPVAARGTYRPTFWMIHDKPIIVFFHGSAFPLSLNVRHFRRC
jgi:hypothetical protein